MCTTCGCDSEALMHDAGPRAHEHPHTHEHADGTVHAHPHTHEHPRAHDVILPEARDARVIRFEQDLLAKNRRLADENRLAFARSGTIVLNFIGSPGAGKTALLEATIRALKSEVPLVVLEGDQATDLDAQRIASAGARVAQINTGAGCHLDAAMVARGLQEVGAHGAKLVLVENVGNLVCPALFDLGEHEKVVVLSVTEGDDKPRKYPHVFRAASVFVVNKMDLLPHVDFDVDRCVAYAREENPDLEVLEVSARRGDGMEAFVARIREMVAFASAARAVS
jgi:hydrogenase nickel incorporation protein HypB